MMQRLLPTLPVVAFLVLSAAASADPGDTIYARPGRLVSAGDGTRLNFVCMGAGSPAVVFESTFGDWAPAWESVLPRIAAWTRACVYEHAGAGFSEPGPMPRTNVRLANELDRALHNARIAGPYILVGNASGAQPARTFAQMYMAQTAGLVLVEPDVTDLEPKEMQDRDHAGNAGGIAELRKCRNAVAAGAAAPEPDCAGFFFRGLPEPRFSSELNAALLNILRSKVAAYDAALAEWEQMPRTEVWLQQHSRSLGRRPVRVLTTGNHAVHFLPAPNADDPRHVEYEHQIELAQARLMTLSSNARQIFVSRSSEYVQFDDPDAVVDAIREVYDQSRGAPDVPLPAPGAQFRDCTNGCPEMVVLPQGSFIMGASPGEEEREKVPDYFRGRSVPQHLVRIGSPLAMGKFDVTRDEYAQFVAETKRPDPDSCYTPDIQTGQESDAHGANWRSPGYPQTGRDPVVCVSWDDAQAYVAWLSVRTRHVYRLPTEAEWEYAARAGTTTARYGSDTPAELCRYINHGDLSFAEAHPHESGVNRECRDGYAFTSPVGSFPPNAFGLYDMLGNVWQWNEDCWNDTYSGAPSDGSSRQSGDCGRRVVRGGAYSNVPGLVLSAVRSRGKSAGRDHSGGFRVARTL